MPDADDGQDADGKQPKDRWFNEWFYPKGRALKMLAEPLTVKVAEREQATGARTNARRGAKLAEFRQRVEGVICNLAYACLKPGDTGSLAVNLRKEKRLRYDNPVFKAEHMKPLLELLEGMGWLHLDKAAFREGRKSTITPSAAFAGSVEGLGVALSDFGRHQHQELLVVTRTKREAVLPQPGDDETGIEGSEGDEDAQEVIADMPTDFRIRYERPSKYVDYLDTPETHALREELRKLNAFIAQADIAYEGSHTDVDVNDRIIRRYFHVPANVTTPGFTLGGRLFCHLTNTPKDERRHLRINGHPVTVLDFASLFPRLAYLRAGHPMPVDDPYQWQGLALHRDKLKAPTNAILFGGLRGRNKPKDMRADLKGITLTKLRAAFARTHPKLLPLLRQDATPDGMPIGYTLMNTESRILLHALNALMAKGIPATSLR